MPTTVETLRNALRSAAAREQCRAETARQYARTRDTAFQLGLAAECDRWARVFAEIADAPLAPTADARQVHALRNATADLLRAMSVIASMRPIGPDGAAQLAPIMGAVAILAAEQVARDLRAAGVE